MRKVFITLCLLILFKAVVYADEYFPDGDITYNRYVDTLGYGISELLESKKCPNCVQYESSKVEGSFTKEVLLNSTISDVTEDDWRYGLVRKWNIYDRVALPPYSSLNFIYWSENRAWEEVNISSLKVLLSREDINNGDLRELLYIEGEYGELPVKYIVYNYPRTGIIKEYPGLGKISVNGGFRKGKVIDTVYVKPAIEYVKWEAQESGENLRVRITVRSVSKRVLKDILFRHNEYSFKRDFQPLEEYTYDYFLTNTEDNNIGYTSIDDPNETEQCVVLGENMESNFVGESVIVGGIREREGVSLPYIGSRIKPLKESFCVKRIPYTLYSEEIEMESKQVVENSSEEDILGVKKLPQTGKGLSYFLVVFPLLWYYLLRRKNI